MSYSRKFFRLPFIPIFFFLLTACTQGTDLPVSTSPAPLTKSTPSHAEEEPIEDATLTAEITAATITTSPTITQIPSPTALFATNVYDVLAIHPHDSDAFTEGLFYEDGFLYESTGLYGHSTLRKVDLESGQTIQEVHLSDNLFGEGLTVVGDKIYLLTWKANVGFVYEKDSFLQTGEFYYPTEGWGLTFDGKNLIMSDGTSTLHFLDPQGFHEVMKLDVMMDGEPVTYINELEYVQGVIYANIWKTTFIMKIDPQTGQVIERIDFKRLIPLLNNTQPIDVMNGIAYDAGDNSLYITGKYWPKVFQVKITIE
jgi:glutamine cyclotransferase